MHISYDDKHYFCLLLPATVKALEIILFMPVILVVLEAAAPDASYEPISCLQVADIKSYLGQAQCQGWLDVKQRPYGTVSCPVRQTGTYMATV